MDRDLGAVRGAQSIDNHRAYGWLYQWGRLADMHEISSSPIIDTLSCQRSFKAEPFSIVKLEPLSLT